MKFYDTHMHSHLSFDCFEDPEAYISEKTEFITFTEHLDLDNTANKRQDDIPNFDELLKWQKQFKEKFNVDLLLGVEIGFVPSHQERLEKIISTYDFDLKLLSVHQNEDYDYMDSVDVQPEIMINKYLDQLLLALNLMKDCHIMTHFDYGFRIHQLMADQLAPYEDKLMAIFQKCADNGLAFELNSKSLYNYDNKDLYEWAIPRYQSVGGTLFSLGSDAHRVDEHFMRFDESIELLEKFGVSQVAQFNRGKLYFQDLEELNGLFK